MKRKDRRLHLAQQIVACFAGLFFLLLPLPSALSETGEEIPTQITYNADGSAAVSFQAKIGVAYQIYCSDSPAASPDQMQWILAADNVVSETGSWTTWVDAGSSTRPHPSKVKQRFYFVTVKPTDLTTKPPTPPASVPSTSTFKGLTQSLRLARLQEAADAARLLAELARGNCQAAIEILRQYGVAESTLKAMSQRICKPTPRVPLNEDFLRAVVSLPLDGAKETVKTRSQMASNCGFPRLCWVAYALSENWPQRFDQEQSKIGAPAVGVLDVQLQEPNAIQFFKWYDRYAEKLHSLALNWDGLSNFDLKNSYADADVIMSGFYKLIKARKPDAFVWVRVVWQEDDSDVRWLQSLTFPPDGLLCWNLHSFRSPFERARKKYGSVVGKETPLVVADFYGYWPQVLSTDSSELGSLIATDLPRVEQRLRALGFRGLVVSWPMVTATQGKTE